MVKASKHKQLPNPFPQVIPWLDWVKRRGLSLSTAERLERAGKIKVTRMSARRKGVREDHDREYLDSCLPTRK
jgi:predicted site-specific integrase-resolvase